MCKVSTYLYIGPFQGSTLILERSGYNGHLVPRPSKTLEGRIWTPDYVLGCRVVRNQELRPKEGVGPPVDRLIRREVPPTYTVRTLGCKERRRS